MVLGIGDPEHRDWVGVHRLAPADTASLLERIGKVRAGADGPSRVLLTYEAGFEGHADNRIIIPYRRTREAACCRAGSRVRPSGIAPGSADDISSTAA